MGNLWMPGAEVRPVRNGTRGQMGEIFGALDHHIVGSLDSAEARFNDPNSHGSAHFGVGFDGSLRHWVALDDVAWHAVKANWLGWIGIENESPGWDDPNTPDNELWIGLSDAQINTNAEIMKFAQSISPHDLLRVTDVPWEPGLGFHSMNPPDFGITGCPGDNVIYDRHRIIAVARGLVLPPPPVVRPKETIVIVNDMDGNAYIQNGMFVLGEQGIRYCGDPAEINAWTAAGNPIIPMPGASINAIPRIPGTLGAPPVPTPVASVDVAALAAQLAPFLSGESTPPPPVDLGPLRAAVDGLVQAAENVRGSLPA